MKCNKCGNELKENDKFCTKCGTSIFDNERINNISNPIQNNIKLNKKIIVTILVILAIVTAIFIYNVNSKNTSKEISNNQDDFEDVEVEINNGYRTFDFTVDDIFEAYSLDKNSIQTFTNSPYCKEHKGTSKIEFKPNIKIDFDKYINIGIIYEDISRKVIMYEVFMNEADIYRVKNDLSIYGNEFIAKLGDITGSGSKSVLFRIKHDATFNNGINKMLRDKETEEMQGRYSLFNEIGVVTVIDTKKRECRTNVIATSEEEFFDLSVNSLTDSSLYNNWLIKEENVEEKDNSTKEKENNITGIEQAIKDRAFEVTDDLSESKLKAAFTDGSLRFYYDNWEKCLEDAQKLNIITSDKPYLTMEEELEQQYYDEQNYNNQSYNREDNSVSNEQPILVKTYNTIKKEDGSDYHIIKIYKYSNGEYSYETDLYTYGSIIPSIISDRQYKTLDEALTSAIQNFREFPLTISDLTEE